jgi:hypothetical protein
MGIRFFCPQGHKLNVKSFLAGKTGFCPYCNSRVEIPLTSTRTSSKASGQEKAAVPLAQPVTEPAEEVPIAQQVESHQVAPVVHQSTVGSPESPGSLAPVAATGGAELADPIAESPQAVWYVRPKAGGQYGPATGDLMRQWLDEGRVVDDTLVWREGWPDWQLAGGSFPKFSGRSRPD